jgi:hypothetical protein
MKLAEPEGCLCGIEACPGHEAIGGISRVCRRADPRAFSTRRPWQITPV